MKPAMSAPDKKGDGNAGSMRPLKVNYFRMKKTIIQTLIGMVVLCLLGACSKAGDKKEDKDTSSDQHTYEISIAGGKTYKGGVPRYAPGISEVYNAVSFVQHDEDFGKIMTGMLQEAGKFQFAIGLALDGDNKPSLQGTGPGLAFGEWGTEDKYRPAGPISMTLKNYKEHNISMYGEEGTVASYAFTFNGKFKLGTDGEEVDVTGELKIAAP